ncbi:ATP-dependent RNA helicase DbpA [Petrocella atlantisensis]|uniref:ATP-dependent RNA helicase DbpA n=1 Tax=Petrocella atlantisensis TaxID=2173034 RepID=A0A3P7PHL3_9FIRM|nr:DEAD/DEAH box helicase [Petrocella atlantisensis]VDN48378.1 ATP-dependent RNA helicase DbpA [Petrocella atlantisensis]
MRDTIKNEFSKMYGIGDDIGRALDVLGYNQPLAVQDRVMPHILEGKDLIVQSQTGSGKTAAFGIPIAEKLEMDENLPQVLVLTPTRELAVQVCEEIASIGRYKKIRCLPIYGKQPIHIQLRQLKQRVHVVVGTPGRLGDLIKRKHLVLEQIKYLVIDEADEMLKRGFLEDVEAIIKRIPKERTTLLFSATMPPEIEFICSEHMMNPLRIEMASTQAPIDQIKQVWYEVSDDWKFMLLTKLMEELKPRSCLIFCNTRIKADQLVQKLIKGKYDCMALHGGMAQKDRLRAISTFKDGEVTYLIATDLAARGIHVDSLDLVVNYNVPMDNENYVHRIGRTGRVGEEGRAITFVSTHDQRKWDEIQTFIGYKVPLEDEKILQQKAISKRTGASTKPKSKREKKDQLHKDITRLRINAGKKKKMRAGDVLGAISNLPGLTSEDIGIIDIQDSCTYVEIFNHKGQLVEEGLSKVKVKGRDVKIKKVK